MEETVSAILSICPVLGCGRVTRGGRCPEHARAEYLRREAKARSLRSSRARQAMREVVVRIQRCERCGRTDDLTAHLPGGGWHPEEWWTGYVVLCRSCHGTVDAPRAKRKGRRGRKFAA